MTEEFSVTGAEMFRSTTIKALATALVAVQSEIKPAKKDSDNPYFHSKYADLASVWEVARLPLTKHGLCITQTTRVTAAGPVLVTTLIHAPSGEWIASEYPLLAADNKPQSLGSSMSYARRYNLSSIIGITATESDDDAEAAMGRNVKPPIQQPSPKPTESDNGLECVVIGVEKVTKTAHGFTIYSLEGEMFTTGDIHIAEKAKNVAKTPRKIMLSVRGDAITNMELVPETPKA